MNKINKIQIYYMIHINLQKHYINLKINYNKKIKIKK